MVNQAVPRFFHIALAGFQTSSGIVRSTEKIRLLIELATERISR
jgi:hypothetical protein